MHRSFRASQWWYQTLEFKSLSSTNSRCLGMYISNKRRLRFHYAHCGLCEMESVSRVSSVLFLFTLPITFRFCNSCVDSQEPLANQWRPIAPSMIDSSSPLLMSHSAQLEPPWALLTHPHPWCTFLYTLATFFFPKKFKPLEREKVSSCPPIFTQKLHF